MQTFQRINIKQIRLFTIICVSMFLASTAKAQSEQFALGADVSWITEMEKAGRKFYTQDGQQMEGMKLLQTLGMNTIRLRVWVNPTDGWCNKEDLLVKAKRADSLGMQLMIDFHYSDWWADPGKQDKPTAWINLNLTDLKNAVKNHTMEVLSLLKTNNITPVWVQVGNETGNGLLWDTGKASLSMSNYVQLHNAGYDGVKAVFPQAKVMVHLHNGYDNDMYRWIFDGMKSYGGRYDIIGMSLYPAWSNYSWQETNIRCLNNMNDMVSRYGKEVMIVETGMSWDNAAEAKLFLADLISKVRTVSSGKGKGVLYWEPQCYNWKGYSLGAFNLSGRPTEAMDAFKIASELKPIEESKNQTYINRDSQELIFKEPIKSCKIFTTEGKFIKEYNNTQRVNLHTYTEGMYLARICFVNNEKTDEFKFVL